jgi:hypothetical protein
VIRGAKVIRPEALEAIPNVRIVVSVAKAKARALIRETLASVMGRREGKDFVFAA